MNLIRRRPILYILTCCILIIALIISILPIHASMNNPNTELTAQTIQVPEKLILHPTGLAYKNHTLYILSRTQLSLFSVNLSTKKYKLIAQPTTQWVLPLNIIQDGNHWLVVDPAQGIFKVKAGDVSQVGSITPSNGFAQINHSVYVVDKGSATITRLDLKTGKATIISSPSVGTGPLAYDPISITSDNDHLYVLDYISKKIFSVDPTHGKRTLLVDLNQYTQKGVSAKQPLFITAANGYLFVSDPQAKQIIRINIKSKQVEVLASNKKYTKDGPAWGAPLGMAFNKHHTLYVGDFAHSAIYAVNINTGARKKIISMQPNSSSTQPKFPAQLLTRPNGHLIIADERLPALFELNPKNNTLTTITSLNKGTGPIMFECIGLGELSRNKLIFSDTFLLGFFQVNINTGKRTFIKYSPRQVNRRVNNRMHDPWGLFLNNKQDSSQTQQQWFVTDGSNSQVFKMTVNTKNLTESHVVINSNKNAGPVLKNLLGITQLSNQNLLVASQGNNILLQINPNNGTRTLISGKDYGSGPPFKSTTGLALLSDHQVILTDSARPALYKINLSSGNRTIISGQGPNAYKGSGPCFQTIASLTLSNDKKTAYVADAAMPGIFSVNLANGDRTLVYPWPNTKTACPPSK